MATKKVDVKFAKDYVNLLSELSKINDKFLVKKTDDEAYIEIESKNAETTVAYILKAEVENFEFKDEEVGFYKFSEFNDLLNVYESPKLKQDDKKFEISQDKSKITYKVADPEAIPKVFKRIEFEDPDLTLALSQTVFDTIKKMIGIVDADNVTFQVVEEGVIVKLSGADEDNTYEVNVDECEIETDEDFSITIPKDIFLLAPKGGYEVQVKEEGIVRFVHQNDNGYELDLYTAENEDD